MGILCCGNDSDNALQQTYDTVRDVRLKNLSIQIHEAILSLRTDPGNFLPLLDRVKHDLLPQISTNAVNEMDSLECHLSVKSDKNLQVPLMPLKNPILALKALE